MRFQAKAAGLLSVLAVLLCGCKATAPSRTGPDAIFLAPEYPTLKLETLCYLGLSSLDPNPVGIQTTDQLLRSYLTGGQQKFIIIDESSARSRARSAGVESDFDKLIRTWRDGRTVDRFVLKTVGEKLGMNGVVFGDLLKWREEQVDWASEGTSFTEVGVAISIYDTSTGILAWKGEKQERRESVHYRHGSGTGSGVYQSGGVERADRADRVAPKPPDPVEVAESVIQTLIDGLPDQPKP